LDKAEYRIKLDQINKLADAGNYKEAVKVVDSIDWKRVKSVRTLCMVAEIYEANGRIEDSLRVLKIAYKRSSISKTVLYRLAELSIKDGEFDEAMDYYTEFAELAPNDNSQYILKYKLYKARKSPIQDQIEILEEYKSREYTEKWAYELARLYHQAGMKEKCVEECDDIILWFSEGTYVNRAMELKLAYGPLSPSQKLKYENRFATTPKTAGVSAVEEEDIEASGYDIPGVPQGSTVKPIMGTMSVPVQPAAASVPEPKPVTPAKVNADALNLQSQLADSIRAVFAGINNKGVSVSDLEIDQEGSLGSEEYTPVRQEPISDYEVKELEPESIGSPVEQVAVPVQEKQEEAPEGQIAGQMSLADYKEEKDPEELDLEALFAETKNALAQQVSTGEFAKVDEPVEEPIAEEVKAEIPEVEEREVEDYLKCKSRD